MVTVASGATFDISASSFGFNPIQNLAGSGTVQLGNNGLVIRNASGEFGGTIVDGGGFGGLQIFAGSMTLTNVSTYHNVTQVWEGATLALKGTGSIANSLYISFAPTAGHGTAVFDISQTTAGASVRGLFDPAAGDRRHQPRRKDAHHHQSQRHLQWRAAGWRSRRRKRRRGGGGGGGADTGRWRVSGPGRR